MSVTTAPQSMDTYCDWNGDLVLTANISIQYAIGWDQLRQRIVRRILTNSAQQLPDGTYTPADYVYAPSFGEGAGAMVDQNPTHAYVLAMQQKINQGVLAETALAGVGTPEITFSQPTFDSFQVTIMVPLTSQLQGELVITVPLHTPSST